ncbi:MAG: ankyrin repeat domain-containing protein [Armatimonadota bacterium]
MKRIVLFLAALALVLGGLGWGYPRVHRWLTLQRPMAAAIASLDRAAISRLVEKGADPNTRADPDGFLWKDGSQTALMTATVGDDTALAKLLLSRGAEIEARDSGGRNALRHACGGLFFRQIKVAQLLVRAGADVNVRDESGVTPLLAACEAPTGSPEIVQLLIRAGADLNAVDRNGRTPLMVLAHSWWVDSPDPDRARCAELLIRAGADVNATLPDGRTALALAEETGCREVARLLRKEASGGLREWLEGRPGAELLHAVLTRNFPEVGKLLRAGQPVDVRTPDGRTPLMIAATDTQDWRMVRVILKFPQARRPEVLEAPDFEGRTLLQWICIDSSWHPQRIRLLIHAGADPYQDSGWRSPIELAQNKARIGHPGMLRAIEQALASRPDR